MTNKILAVVTPDSAPIKRMISDAREARRLIDATYGRRTRSVIIMENGTLTLSAITPETIGMRAVDDGTRQKEAKN